MAWFISYFIFCSIISAVVSARSTMQSFPGVATNLTKITWAHAVNNKSLLEEALSSEVMMLEADILLGKVIGQKSDDLIPIMGHPPADVSDLSLEQFLSTILLYNNHNKNNTKGIKLDFKSIEVFEKSIQSIQNIYAQMDYPVWINADIIAGPVGATNIPVDPTRFLKNAKKFETSILSIGWTTNYGVGILNAVYTPEEVQSMLDAIKTNNVTQNITFPVRAGIAAESIGEMKKLIGTVQNSTLTIWSSPSDPVNVENLRSMIFEIGLDKVYVDVPEDLKKELHLDTLPKF